MFSENLKAMRKAKGYTQEELAIKLNVTRQTISKWEKGLSVPDVDFLFKIADVLETNVGTLLGGAIMDEVNKDTVAEQLAKISEQLAIKNRRSNTVLKDFPLFCPKCKLTHIIDVEKLEIVIKNTEKQTFII